MYTHPTSLFSREMDFARMLKARSDLEVPLLFLIIPYPRPSSSQCEFCFTHLRTLFNPLSLTSQVRRCVVLFKFI